MLPNPKETLKPVLHARVASLLPDRSRLNFLLTNKFNFQDYKQFLKDSLLQCNQEQGIQHTSCLLLRGCTVACPLKHAIEYSDVPLLRDLLNAHVWKNKDGLTAYDLDRLVGQCITASSSKCLSFLCKISPYVRREHMRYRGDDWREYARLQYHTPMTDVLNRYHAPFAEGHWNRYVSGMFGMEFWIDKFHLRYAKLYEHGIWVKGTKDVEHARLYEAGSAEVFRFLFNKAQSNLQPKQLAEEIWQSLCVQVGAFETSACLVQTILSLGHVNVDSIYTLRNFDPVVGITNEELSGVMPPSYIDTGTETMTILDYAVSNLNIDAVCALRNRGANMGGARGVKYDQATTDAERADVIKIPSPIWRIFDQQIQAVDCCFWAKHHLDKDNLRLKDIGKDHLDGYSRTVYDGESRACTDRRRLCSETPAVQIGPDPPSDYWHSDDEYSDAEDSSDEYTSIDDDPGIVYAITERGWLDQLKEFSDNIALLLKLILESGVDIGNDLCKEGESFDLHLPIMDLLPKTHPVHRLLLLTRDILNKLSVWDSRNRPSDWSPEPISKLISCNHESFESLGMAYDLLAARDPVLKAGDEISQKKGFCRMMEILDIEPIEVLPMPWQLVDLEGISHPSGRHWPRTGGY
ncbi:hypothetical protein F5Y18DRAFT_442687 [Xylariaceae sp. FL1019]|nr:hypothetical protein F5Y18DRAFT_442687 [Xylariaceae sp. FL1019]